MYIKLEKEKNEWLFVAAALFIFSPTWYVASCHELHLQLPQCKPISYVQDEFVLCETAYQGILQRFLICRVQHAVFSFPFSPFFYFYYFSCQDTLPCSHALAPASN